MPAPYGTSQRGRSQIQRSFCLLATFVAGATPRESAPKYRRAHSPAAQAIARAHDLRSRAYGQPPARRWRPSAFGQRKDKLSPEAAEIQLPSQGARHRASTTLGEKLPRDRAPPRLTHKRLSVSFALRAAYETNDVTSAGPLRPRGSNGVKPARCNRTGADHVRDAASAFCLGHDNPTEPYSVRRRRWIVATTTSA